MELRQPSNNNQRRVMPQSERRRIEGEGEGRGREKRRIVERDERSDETNAKERASQIETNGDLYASRRIPQFYCRLISSPASDGVLLLLLRRLWSFAVIVTASRETFRAAPKETDTGKR